MAPDPHLFSLIDAYAAAAAEREQLRECAAWAFLAAHERMAAARGRVAAALGLDPAALAPLDDDASQLAGALTHTPAGSR